MCGCNRRDLVKFLTGAGVAPLLPRTAQAASISTLAVTCIDFRLVDDAVRFFGRRHLTGDYDQVSLAGASLAAVSPKFPSANAAFWDQLAISRTLHHVRRLIVVDHRDCGAFKVAFSTDYRGDRAGETEQHRQVMEQVKAKLADTQPGLAAEFYLMALNGRAERVI